MYPVNRPRASVTTLGLPPRRDAGSGISGLTPAIGRPVPRSRITPSMRTARFNRISDCGGPAEPRRPGWPGEGRDREGRAATGNPAPSSAGRC